jgi:hypothetical protein
MIEPKNSIMTHQIIQMELAFETAHASFDSPSSILHPRLKRSAWWFGRMRRIVDLAFDWRPAPPSRPEQIWFTDLPFNARAEIGVQSASSSAFLPASRSTLSRNYLRASKPENDALPG